MKEYIDIILKEANKAYKCNEVPVGCIIVKDGKILSKAHNIKQKSHKCIDHAEILAITKAEKILKDWRLNDCEMYVTLEPCNMCKEVIRQARINKVYYILNSKFINENSKNIEYHLLNISNDVIDKYKEQLSSFFAVKR